MNIMSMFGSMAVFLAAVGIYGVMSYSVQQRTQEIGIRIAFGAEASQVRNMVVRHGLTLTIVGVVIGLGAAWKLALFLQALMSGVRLTVALVRIAARFLDRCRSVCTRTNRR